MQISKDTIIEMIRSRGEPQNADQAQAELPEQVDTENDKGLLDKFGIDPQQLLGGLGGKFGL